MAAAVVAPAMDDSGDAEPNTARAVKQLDKLGVRLPCAFARTHVEKLLHPGLHVKSSRAREGTFAQPCRGRVDLTWTWWPSACAQSRRWGASAARLPELSA